MMQILRATIRWTLAGQKAKPQPACSDQHYPSSNLPTGWGSPTVVHSTSGRKYRWLGFFSITISPESRDRTVCNTSEMDTSTGRRQVQMFWRHSKPCCNWKLSILLNGFSNSGFRCF
jgi:hypothetical protein